jgi:predicted DNA-binding ribbon-helix-helix protein
MKASVAKRVVARHSIVLAGHRTSVSLEDEFWSGLREIADRRDKSASHLIATINANRKNANLSSAIRLFVLNFYQKHNRRRHADGYR